MNKKRIVKIVIKAISTCMIVGILSGCGTSENKQENMSGSILSLGSSALQPLATEAAKQFKVKYTNIDVQVQGGGSGNGLKAVVDGTAQIGNSDIFAEEKEGIDAKILEDHKVCVGGYAVISNPNSKIDNLTKKQLIDVFTGKITNWKDIGGDDMKIVLINRPASSGTRATFKKYALDGKDEGSGQALTEDQSGTVLKAVSDTPGSISYLGFAYLNNTIKVLKLDGVEPNPQNVANGSYPIWSYEHMYTKGAAQGIIKEFIDYMLSDEVKPIIQKLGYISISDMKVTR